MCACVLMHLTPAAKFSVVVTTNRFVQLRVSGAGSRTLTNGDLCSIVHYRHTHLSPWTNHLLTNVFVSVLSQRHLREKYRSAIIIMSNASLVKDG